MEYREDRGYYERKSLEDSMKSCLICLIGIVAVAVSCVIYGLLK